MSRAALKQTLENVLGRTLTPAQVARVASAFYQPQEGETNDEAASIVLNKLRRFIVEKVKAKEAEDAAEEARRSTRELLDGEFGTFNTSNRGE